jgi:hypothetical protein
MGTVATNNEDSNKKQIVVTTKKFVVDKSKVIKSHPMMISESFERVSKPIKNDK